MRDFSDVDVIIPFRAADPYRCRNADHIEAHLVWALPGARVARYDDPDPDVFNRGRATNVGVTATDRPVLLVADGDVWLPRWALQDGVDRVRRGVGSYVVPFSKILWFHEPWTNDVFAGTADIAKRPPQAQILLEWGNTSCGISNVFSRKNFEKFGGFDPRFHGWGFEDVCWDIVAETLGGKKVRLHHEGRHLFHHPCPSKENSAQIAVGQALHRRYGGARGRKDLCQELRDEVLALRKQEGM